MTQSKLAELVAKWRGLSSHVPLDDFYADALHACADELEAALSQQPAVDEAMVLRACNAYDAAMGRAEPNYSADYPAMHAALTAAIGAQHEQ